MSDKNFETKLDDIAKDISFMKGQLSESMPLIKTTISEHEKRILLTEKFQENFKGKVAVAGGFAGLTMSALFTWIGKHI